MSTKATYPLSAARALALDAQGLADQPDLDTPSTPEQVYAAVERVGCLQIDTLQMVRRSHYVALWSRLGAYDPEDLDALVYDPARRRLFEYWLHAASIIPLSEYRYRLLLMRHCAEGTFRSRRRWLEEPGNVETVDGVRRRVREEGAVRVSDFSDERVDARKGWWDWKPAKRALEYLFDLGELMVSGRVSFQRVYDLRERVLPSWVDTSEPTEEEAIRHLLEWSMRRVGICTPRQLVDYARMKVGETRQHLRSLMDEGVFVEVSCLTTSGQAERFIVHRDSMDTLKRAADGGLVPSTTTFLTPFDSLFWAPGRDVQLWDFEQRLEAYVPAPKRRWGYFCLPIVHGDRLVGRFDPKLERATGTLRLKALHLEPGVEPDEELATSFSRAMRGFMAFHGATDLVVEGGNGAAVLELAGVSASGRV